MEIYNVDNTETVTLMEWCAGYAGIGLGLKRVFGERLRTIAYSELEGYAQANLISKMEKGLLDVAPIWTDIKTFPCKEFHGLVDIFSAGYPCQPFSCAGERGGESDPRHLWPFIQRAVAIIQPRFCFFENVRGHLTLGFKNVCHDLAELGYEVVAGLFTAAECGAPHKRERLYILAHSKCFRSNSWGETVFKESGNLGELQLSNSKINWNKFSINYNPEKTRGEIYNQPILTRNNDGDNPWVDRCKLSGNGVVPAAAELAFRTLFKELQ